MAEKKKKESGSPYHAMEGKYRVVISKRRPVVVRLDAMNATKRHVHELSESDNENDRFYEALQTTAAYLSKRFGGIAFCTADEISLVCMSPPVKYSKELTTSRVGSLVGQSACLKFASAFHGKGTVNFDAKVFSINRSVINGYIEYRRKSGRNTQVTYIAKDYMPRLVKNKTKMDDIVKVLKKYGYEIDEYAWNGKLFKKGKEIQKSGN